MNACFFIHEKLAHLHQKEKKNIMPFTSIFILLYFKKKKSNIIFRIFLLNVYVERIPRYTALIYFRSLNLYGTKRKLNKFHP